MCTNQFKIILYQQNTNLHSDVFFYIIRRIKLVKLTCLTLLEQVKILSIEPLIPAVVVNFGFSIAANYRPISLYCLYK